VLPPSRYLRIEALTDSTIRVSQMFGGFLLRNFLPGIDIPLVEHGSRRLQKTLRAESQTRVRW
jgi:hypothetical protein